MFFEAENLPVDSVCLNEILCLKITVQSRSGHGIGDGEFSVKWKGKLHDPAYDVRRLYVSSYYFLITY